MKKIFLLTLFCLIYKIGICQSVFGQRCNIVEIIDEFGNKTGKYKKEIILNGYFSNSATTNSPANLFINLSPIYSWIDFDEYCDYHMFKKEFYITFIGKNSTKYNFQIKNNEFHKNRNKLYDLSENNDTIYIKLEEINKYTSTPTTAVFIVNTDCLKRMKFPQNKIPNKNNRNITILHPLYIPLNDTIIFNNLISNDTNIITIAEYKDIIHTFSYVNPVVIKTCENNYKVNFNKLGKYEVTIENSNNITKQIIHIIQKIKK